MSRDKTRFYHTGKYAYMDHHSFQIKWGVIRHFVLQHSSSPRRILDLACGKVTLIDFITPLDYESYVGIDSSEEVVQFLKYKNIEKTSWLHDNIEDIAFPKLSDTFNVLLWCGIETYIESYSVVLEKFEPLLTDDAIIILDYMLYSPSDWKIRVGNIKLYHIDGCRLKLSYVSKEISGWSKINTRIIECLSTKRRNKI